MDPVSTHQGVMPAMERELQERIEFLEQGQLATLNILEDLNEEREKMVLSQRATINILEDYNVEKDRLEDIQKATINILDDFDAEREKLEHSQRATINILDDFNLEKMRMEDSQRATINILEDLNVEKDKAEQANVELHIRSEELKITNSELEQFAYVASHDLQEPLRMVASYVQLLARRYGDSLDEDAHDFINYAVDGANRMQVMIRDLLEYSRVGTKGRPFEKFESELALARALKNLKFSIEENQAVISYGRLPAIVGDFSQIAQLFQNLIGNGIKFRHNDIVPRIVISAAEKDSAWEFSVHDNGVGIDEEYFDRIFIIFQRLQGFEKFGAAGGTGIGLAICKRIVERHSGRIWLESRPGEGTTFFFTIPKVEPDDVEDSGGGVVINNVMPGEIQP